jgi:hypothetical protein
MRLLVIATGVVVAALLGARPVLQVVEAQKNRPKSIPVIVTFADDPSHNVRSDDGGPYQDGVSNVVAYINASANGGLIFGTNTQNTAGRTLYVSLLDCLTVPCDETPFSADYVKSGIQSAPLREDGLALSNGLLGMTVGSLLRAWVKITIPQDEDPAYWTMCMRPADGGGGICSISTGSTPIWIRREAPDLWTLYATPEPAENPSDKADLLKDIGSGKHRTVTVEGTYSMPFAFTVQCVRAADCP